MIVLYTDGTGAPDGHTAGLPTDAGTVAVDTASAVTHYHQGVPFTSVGRVAVTVDGIVDYIGAGGAGYAADGRMVISSDGTEALRTFNGVGYALDYPAPENWFSPI